MGDLMLIGNEYGLGLFAHEPLVVGVVALSCEIQLGPPAHSEISIFLLFPAGRKSEWIFVLFGSTLLDPPENLEMLDVSLVG